MSALVEVSDRARTRRLIIETKEGTITEEEKKTLDDYMVYSVRLYVGSVDGEFCCAWGLIPPTMLSDQAYLWLFSTPAVEKYKFVFVRRSQIIVKEMLEEWPIITGFCESDAGRSMRWLKWLGAEFGNPIKTFVPFVIRK